MILITNFIFGTFNNTSALTGKTQEYTDIQQLGGGGKTGQLVEWITPKQLGTVKMRPINNGQNDVKHKSNRNQ